eukprot:gene5733-biopygen8426
MRHAAPRRRLLQPGSPESKFSVACVTSLLRCASLRKLRSSATEPRRSHHLTAPLDRYVALWLGWLRRRTATSLVSPGSRIVASLDR